MEEKWCKSGLKQQNVFVCEECGEVAKKCEDCGECFEITDCCYCSDIISHICEFCYEGRCDWDGITG